jgi:hypothetical protein
VVPAEIFGQRTVEAGAAQLVSINAQSWVSRGEKKMPCWPDVWEHAKEILPKIGVVAVLLVFAVIIAILFWAPLLQKRWLRVSSRILGAVMLLPFLMLVASLIFGFMLAGGNPPAQSRTARSSDGDEATVEYYGGFLGRDFTSVTLKRLHQCPHVRVFWLQGSSFFDDVQLVWLDNRHLQISYHASRDDSQHCENRAGEITISCLSQPWPEPPAQRH